MNLPNKIPIIITNRFVLREITDCDAESYFELCSDKEVMNFYGVKHHESIEETKNLIKYLSSAFESQKMIRWGIFEDDKLIGDIGYWRFVTERFRAEIGAKIKKSFWRSGVANEALQAVIDHGLYDLGLNSIEGNIEPSNHGSIKMVDKIGFEREGLIKSHSYNQFTDSFVDTILYSIRKEHRHGKNRNS